MPRNVKESDDELEIKGGRRTRTALSSSVLDSPLRRSTRIKQPVAQDVSSPESNSDVSSVGGTRTTRRRTTGLDGGIPEATRNLRTRHNSGTSDVSELAENDLLAESSGRRITRRSVAGLPTVETPTKLPPRTRRGTRAGSETKSTPPVGRITRRTRASSMEPEVSEELKIPEVGTPVKSRRRASALPSEPAVAEESEDVHMEKTVLEMDEDETETPHISKLSRRVSKGGAGEGAEKMEVDENPVVESEVDTIERSFQELTEASSDTPEHSPKKDSTKIPVSPGLIESREKSSERRSLSSPVKGSSYTIENLLNSAEKEEKSLGNKENEISNTPSGVPERSVTLVSSRKSLNSSFSKDSEKRSSLSVDNETCSDYSKIVTESQEIDAKDVTEVARETPTKRDHSLDTECRVLIEPMNVEKFEKIGALKTDTLKTHYKERQQTGKSDEKEKEDLKSSTESKENEDITNQVGTMRITNVVSMATEDPEKEKKGKEKEEQDDNDDDDDDDDDDLQIIEIIDPTQTIGKSLEKTTLNEEITDEKSSSGETMTRESSMDREISKESTNNEEIVAPEETTSLNPEAKIRESSMDNESPIKTVDNEESVLKTTSPGVEMPEILESLINEDNAKKSDLQITWRTVTSPAGSGNQRGFSTYRENEKKTSGNEEIIVCEMAKDRKSSIVTESPSHERKSEEASRLSVGEIREEPQSNGIPAKSGDEQQCERSKSIADKSEENDDGDDEFRVSDSENDSETIVCPSFKDIPADEWLLDKNEETKRSNHWDGDLINAFSSEYDESEETKRSNHWDGDLINAFSSEYDESECDLALVDKESCQLLEIDNDNNREEKLGEKMNYDTDDTVIARIEKSTAAKNDEREKIIEEVINEEIPTDLSNDMEEEENEADKSNFSKGPSSKRESLNSSKKLRNKNAKIIMDNDSNAVTRRPTDNSSEDDVDGIETKKTPKTGQSSRRSLVNSAKKSERLSLLDTSNKLEKRKPLNKSPVDLPETVELAPDPGELEIEKETVLANMVSRMSSRADKIAPRLSISANRSMAKESSDKDNSESEVDESDSQKDVASPDALGKRLNRSVKLADPRGTPISKNNSRIEQESSDYENKVNDSPQKLNRSAKLESNRKSLKSKNDLMMEQESSDSEIESEEDEDLQPKLNRSSKSESNRKSVNNKNNSKKEQSSSESEIAEGEDLQPKFNRSSKWESNRKSVNSKNNSMKEHSSSESESGEDKDLQPKLNRSSKSERDRKSAGRKSPSTLEAINSDSEIEEEKDLQPKSNRSAKSESNRKSAGRKSLSTVEAINLNSDVENDVESSSRSSSSSDEESDGSQKIPKYFFDVDTSSSNNNNSENEDSEGSIDSDVAKDMNLAGESHIEYSDDDVPADDCRLTESESSDSEGDDGEDLINFIVNDDDEESEDAAMELGDETSSSDYEIAKEKTRKRIISRPAGDSDSLESDEDEEKEEEEQEEKEEEEEEEEKEEEDDEIVKTPKKPNNNESVNDQSVKVVITKPSGESYSIEYDKEAAEPLKIFSTSGDKSIIEKTPKREKKSNDSIKIIDTPVQKIDLNEARRDSARRKKDLSLEGSTPKLVSRQSLLLEKSDSTKSKKSPRVERTPTSELETSRKSSRFSIIDTKETTPGKLVTSLKQVQATPKTPKTTKLQRKPCVPTDHNESDDKTSSLKVQSINSRRTMSVPSTDSPEARFLMKEKLNETLPALKLQQRARELRGSVSDYICVECSHEEDEVPNEEKFMTAEASELVNPEKKKRKKKKKKKDADKSNDLTEESVGTSLRDASVSENQKTLGVEGATKKSEKRKRNKAGKIMEIEETSEIAETEEIPQKKKKRKRAEAKLEIEETGEIVEIEEMPQKKKKRKRAEAKLEIEETSEIVEIEEMSQKKKKGKRAEAKLEPEIVQDVETVETVRKKKKKNVQNTEPEVSNSRKNTSRLPAQSDFLADEPRNIVASTNAVQVTRKNKKETSTSVRGLRKIVTRSTTSKNPEKFVTKVKRLPDDVLESLPEVNERSSKRRKIAREENIVPSRQILTPKITGSIEISDDFISLSTSGSTTQFGVVDLAKIPTKKSKRAVAVKSFRERMLARNPRQPVSAYLMYQQKQKASGKHQTY